LLGCPGIAGERRERSGDAVSYTEDEMQSIVRRTVEACARTLERVAPKYMQRQEQCCRYAARVLRGDQDAELRDPYLRGWAPLFGDASATEQRGEKGTAKP
jgi:hypothetical protein